MAASDCPSMLTGDTAAAPECSVPVPSAILALPSASLSAPVASCEEPDASLVLPAESSEAPAARAWEPLSRPGLAGTAGVALDAGVQGHGSVGEPGGAPRVILAAALSRPGCSGSPGTPSMPTRILEVPSARRRVPSTTPGLAGSWLLSFPASVAKPAGELARSRVQLARAVLQPLRAGLQLLAPASSLWAPAVIFAILSLTTDSGTSPGPDHSPPPAASLRGPAARAAVPVLRIVRGLALAAALGP